MENELKKYIRDVPDFPKQGIIFKDLTPIFNQSKIFKRLIDYLYKKYKKSKIDKIVCIEARGFLIGAPLAYKLGKSLVPARKKGKLPGKTLQIEYALEYGTDKLEILVDAIKKDEKVLIIDDLLATGGTTEAVCKLVEKFGAKVAELAFVVELDFLKGRDKLENYKVFSIVHY